MTSLEEIIQALEIFKRYGAKTIESEHNIILVDKIAQEQVSKEDAATLDTFGFFFSEEYNCWARFT